MMMFLSFTGDRRRSQGRRGGGFDTEKQCRAFRSCDRRGTPKLYNWYYSSSCSSSWRRHLGSSPDAAHVFLLMVGFVVCPWPARASARTAWTFRVLSAGECEVAEDLVIAWGALVESSRAPRFDRAGMGCGPMGVCLYLPWEACCRVCRRLGLQEAS